MKKTTIKYMSFLTVLGLLVTLAACTKGFDKINDSPNTPKNVPNSYLLSCAEKGLIDFTWDRWWNGTRGMLLAQYYAENSYTTESQYFFTPDVTKSYWTNFYASGLNDQGNGAVTVAGLKNLQMIIDNCNASPTKYLVSGSIQNQKAVSAIIMVWTYQNMTDAWGDIPFSQALQDVKITQPKYDKQADIYMGLMARLDTAIASIDLSKSDLQGDLIYGGNMNQWMKFANSLKLRVAIRMADRNSGFAGQKIAEAVNGGIFSGNADIAQFVYASDAPNYNPLYFDRAVNGRKDFCASNTIVDVMNNLGDGRIGYYFDSVNGGIYVGRPYGQNPTNAGNMGLNQVSQPSGAFYADQALAPPAGLTLSATAAGIYMDYAETQFILAEAAERGYAVGGSAQSYYNAGISASFQFWTGAAVSSAYLTQPSVDYLALKGSGKTWRQIIGKQKWLALYMQGIEGWTEWRRLDFGILQLPVDGELVGTGIPLRLTYPFSESQLNPTGYNAAISDQGADLLSTRVWWDVN